MTGDKFIVDSVTEIQQGLRFNVLFCRVVDNKESVYFGILGMRLLKGCMYPPSTFAKGRYFEAVTFGERCALGVYDALATKLAELKWSEKYPLIKPELSIDGLVDRSKLTRNFPSVVEGLV